MINIVLENHHFKWLDVILPTREELQQLAKTYEIHLTSIQDCLQPEHLPKYEKIGDVNFLITRGYDEKASENASNVLELTRKVAIFLGADFLITVHRVDLDYLAAVRQKWQVAPPSTSQLPFQVLCDVLQAISLSYEAPLDAAEGMLDAIEDKIFMRQFKGVTLRFQEIYLLRRKISVYQRMLHLTLEILAKLNSHAEHTPLLQNIKDDTHRLLFVAEQLSENVNHLLNLHLSLTSNRTNEVMRILTLFSVFFLPITFVVGIYGMNFHYMPELELSYGYFGVWLLMLAITVALFIWFKRKGFL
ncbi:MAG: CorA family divalent cation transporter [Thiotrichaceae bacterium]